jgi:hypothetical protein
LSKRKRKTGKKPIHSTMLFMLLFGVDVAAAAAAVVG